MKDILRKILIEILYLTPIGYIISFIQLFDTEKSQGIDFTIDENKPFQLTIKPKPTSRERLGWFFRGLVLVIQGLLIINYTQGLSKNLGDFPGAYAMLAIIFGLISIISAFFPRISWNKNIF